MRETTYQYHGQIMDFEKAVIYHCIALDREGILKFEDKHDKRCTSVSCGQGSFPLGEFKQRFDKEKYIADSVAWHEEY